MAMGGWGSARLGDPRMRIYVDEEVNMSSGADPAVDYTVALAHGISARDNATTFPFSSSLFGHTHTMGWYSYYKIPFQKQVKVTMQCTGKSTFWFRVGGAEDVPIAVGDFELPTSARLHVKRFKSTVGMGALVDLASISGSAGMLTSVNMLVSSTCAYQEGCMQATVDGKKLWVSSGLEDFFLGSNFHSMPNYQLPTAGFYLDNSSRVGESGWREGLPNALSAFRIMDKEPIIFKDSLLFQWQPHGEQASLAANHPISCNKGWPQRQDGPTPAPDARGNRTVGTVEITSLSYIYTWG